VESSDLYSRSIPPPFGILKSVISGIFSKKSKIKEKETKIKKNKETILRISLDGLTGIAVYGTLKNVDSAKG